MAALKKLIHLWVTRKESYIWQDKITGIRL